VPRLFADSPTVGADVLAEVASLASSVDCDDSADRRPLLAKFAERGALDLGLPGSRGTYLDQVLVFAEAAGACMTTAFSAWAHRMTAEYLVRFGGEAISVWIDGVRSGDRPGSTALAATFRAAAGLEELPVTVDRSSGVARASGFISWASNLYDDAIVVTGVLDGDRRRIVAFPLAAPGVEVKPVSGLLALDASRSGAVVLDGVAIDEAWFLDVDFDAFVRHVRPVFLAFQTAFCLGLSAASIAESQEPRGVAVSLLPDVRAKEAALADLTERLRLIATWLDDREGDVPVHPVRLRLDAAHLATSATQLELAVKGGGAYAASSPTARRVREALFLPVQSPTEAQLQWELRHSA
jgi:alkylation response protein AidB-like acyl-CoA dehydrogenase